MFNLLRRRVPTSYRYEKDHTVFKDGHGAPFTLRAAVKVEFWPSLRNSSCLAIYRKDTDCCVYFYTSILTLIKVWLLCRKCNIPVQ